MRDRYESKTSVAPSSLRPADGLRAGRDLMAKTDRPFAGSSVMSRWNRCALVLLALTTGSAAYADSITTLFANDNAGDNGGTVYFDVNVQAPGVVFEAFDMNTRANPGFPFTVEISTTPVTAVGKETDPGEWHLVASGSGTTAGADLPSFVDTDDFFLSSGTYGLAITLTHPDPSVPTGHAYTNGNGANQHYFGPGLEFDLGSATNGPFSAPVFEPRVWNGTIHYNLVPEPASLMLLALGVPLMALRRVRAGSV
jgi:hypothetical protein